MQKLANAIQNAILEIATSGKKNSDQLSPIVRVEIVAAKW